MTCAPRAALIPYLRSPPVTPQPVRLPRPLCPPAPSFPAKKLSWQVNVPRTSIISIKPKFIIVNKLEHVLQYFPTRLNAPSRTAQNGQRAFNVSDVVRPRASAVTGAKARLGGAVPWGAAEPDGTPGHHHHQPPAPPPRAVMDDLQPLDLGAAAEMQREASTPEELDRASLEQLPTCPPHSATPLYAFDTAGHAIKDTAALCLFLRIAAPSMCWSPALPLDTGTPCHFFADAATAPSSADDAQGRSPTILRVSMHEQGPTVFVTIEDATETPPCQILNESEKSVWFAVLVPNAKLTWHELPRGEHVAVLWGSRGAAKESEAAAPKKAQRPHVLVSTHEPETGGWQELHEPRLKTARDARRVAGFDWRLLYKPTPIFAQGDDGHRGLEHSSRARHLVTTSPPLSRVGSRLSLSPRGENSPPGGSLSRRMSLSTPLAVSHASHGNLALHGFKRRSVLRSADRSERPTARRIYGRVCMVRAAAPFGTPRHQAFCTAARLMRQPRTPPLAERAVLRAPF